MHWLRDEDAEPGTSSCDFDYVYSANETFHVLEGLVHITLNDGQPVDLGPGDIATFLEGTFSHWTV